MKTRNHRPGIFTFFTFLSFLIVASIQINAQGWRATTTDETYQCYLESGVARTADGGYLACNSSMDSTLSKRTARLHKVDQDGSVLWTKHIPIQRNVSINDFIACSDGNFLMVGKADSLGNNRAAFALKVDGLGNIIWEAPLNSINDKMVLNKVVESSNGGYLFSGASFAGNGSVPYNAMMLLKLDVNGDKVWSVSYSNAYYGNDLVENSDGTIMVVGARRLVKFSATGGLVWEKDYGPISTVGIEKATDGYFLIFNNGYLGFGGTFSLMKVDLDGNEIWTVNNPNSNEHLNGLLTTNDGQLFLYGVYSDGALSMKIDTSGAIIWRQEIRENIGFQNAVLTANGEYVCSGLAASSQITTQVYSGPDYTIQFDIDCNEARQDEWCDYSTIGVTATLNSPTATPPFNYIWFDGNASQTNPSVCLAYTYYLTITDAAGVSYPSQLNPAGFSGNRVEVVKLDSTGQLYNSVVSGNVFKDDDGDCSYTVGEPGLHDYMVLVDGDESFATLTDSSGNFSFGIDSGAYTITTVLPSNAFVNCVPFLPFNVNNNDSVQIDWPVWSYECANMRINIVGPSARDCMTRNYYFNYCNTGSLDAYDSYVEVEFDTSMTVVSSSIPWSSQSGNLYTFSLDTVPFNTCGTFSVSILHSCYLTLGEAICMNAHIYPDTLCSPPSALWDGSFTELSSQCLADSVEFQIKNTGLNSMSAPLNYYVVEDNVILKTGNFQLNPNEIENVKVPSNGSTYRIYADQAPGYFPDGYQPTEFVEACGVNSSGTFSTGFVNQLPPSNLDHETEFCAIVTGPYDPNDKTAIPEGFGTDHFIHQNVELNYRIRFQNIGTDTAFQVVVRDTLSEHLDIASFQQGASSHPYQLEIVGNNILKFTFSNINLVDSTTNEPDSHGFVSFNICQMNNLPIGTMIYNSAAIYFDYEAPIITNQTYHEVGEDFIPNSNLTGVNVQVRLLLEGPYLAASDLMTDNLRIMGLLPIDEPYTDLGYVLGGWERVSSSVFATTGADAIVDWIVLELRDAGDFTVTIGARAALLQADGDIVDLDGLSSVLFENVPAGNYYIVARHRNHLDVMTPGSIALSQTSTLHDFSKGSAYSNTSTPAQRNLGGGKFGMFSCDFDNSGLIDAQDRSAAWNFRNHMGYLVQDVDFNGACDAFDRSYCWNNRNLFSHAP